MFDENRAFFDGTLLPIGLMDYGHLPVDVKIVNICFSRDDGHWVGKIDYLSTDFEWKTMQVYTDTEHSVGAFAFDDRVVYAPRKLQKMCAVSANR